MNDYEHCECKCGRQHTVGVKCAVALKEMASSKGALISCLVFEPCDYATAVEHYQELKDFILNNDLAWDSGIEGIIHSPQRPGSPDEVREVPLEDVAKTDWIQKTTIAYYPDRRDKLVKIKLPAGAHWEGDLLAVNG